MAPNDAIGWPNCLRCAGVLAGFADRALRAAAAHRAQLEAAEVQDVERDLVSLADLAEQVLRGHLHVLQNDRRRRRAVQAHLVLFLAARHAAERALDDEGGEVLAVDLGEDDEDVGEAAVGDPHLLAVQDEAAVGLSRRARLRAERVGAGARFAEAVGADDLAGHQPRQVLAASAPRCRTATAAGSMRFACAPKVAPNDAERDICSLTTIDETLSSCEAAVRLGRRRRRAARARRSAAPAARASAQSFCSRRSSTGSTSLLDEIADRSARSAGARRSAAPA